MDISDWLSEGDWRDLLASANDAVGFDQAPSPECDAASTDLSRPIPDARQAEPGVVPVLPESVERILAEVEWSETGSGDLLRGATEGDWWDVLSSTDGAAGFDQAPSPECDAASIDLRIPDARQAEPGIVPVLPESVERILAEIGWSATDSGNMLRGTYETDEAGNRVPQRDFLSGGSGNDSLRGGGNSDFLVGGPGADTFIFRASDFDDGMMTLDIIYDFDINEGDRLLGDQSAFRIVEPGDPGPYSEFGPFGFGIVLEHTPTGDYIFIRTSDTDLTLDQLFA